MAPKLFSWLGGAVLVILAVSVVACRSTSSAPPSPPTGPTEVQAELSQTPALPRQPTAPPTPDQTPAPELVIAPATLVVQPFATRAPRPGLWPVPTEVVIEEKPQSTPVVQGRAYPFELSTHCGVDVYVDFDGSFWDVDDPSVGSDGFPSFRVDFNYEQGTMTLVDQDHAVFACAKGTIKYQRHRGVYLLTHLCV